MKLCTCTKLLLLLQAALLLAHDFDLRGESQMTDDRAQETDIWAMQLAEGTDPHEIARRHGHDYLECLAHLGNVHIFKRKPDTVHGVTHPPHTDSVEIQWEQRQVERQRAKRSPVSDPFYAHQWHLHSISNEPNVNAEAAWARGITGEGVNIAIVDDGLEYTHPDLAQNYRAAYSYDFNYGDEDPFPDSTRDDHGTSAGGVAAARDNAVCGVGSAYRAGLAGIRLISKASTDVQEAGALSWKHEYNHIYSNSWGPVDDGKRKEGPGKLASASLEVGIRQGRQGKGVLYVWAGGNGRRSRDNCNYDGWANHRYTISIAAVDYSGEQAWYSESCSMLVVSAPSSGFGSKSIFTTDLLGGRGTSRDDCTSTFGGTSAAAPLAAGVVALILEANQNLTWRDVQAVLIDSAAKHRENDHSWQTNGAGVRYSHNFGFGLIDAGRAVLVASEWENLPPEYNVTARVEPNAQFGESYWQNVSIPCNESFIVEHVHVWFSATVTRRGDLLIYLVSPSGTVSYLTEEHGDGAKDYDNWRFGSIANWGENSLGMWTVTVRETRAGYGGSVLAVQLDIFGHKEIAHGKR